MTEWITTAVITLIGSVIVWYAADCHVRRHAEAHEAKRQAELDYASRKMTDQLIANYKQVNLYSGLAQQIAGLYTDAQSQKLQEAINAAQYQYPQPVKLALTTATEAALTPVNSPDVLAPPLISAPAELVDERIIDLTDPPKELQS